MAVMHLLSFCDKNTSKLQSRATTFVIVMVICTYIVATTVTFVQIDDKLMKSA